MKNAISNTTSYSEIKTDYVELISFNAIIIVIGVIVVLINLI
jgi:hypothetical protein